MPWQAVQFLRMTCQTGPSGRVTCGRAGLRPICAHNGSANSAARTGFANFTSTTLRDRQRSGTRTETLAIDAVLMENAQQHVRSPLPVVRENDVAIPLERAVDAAYQNNRHFLVCVYKGSNMGNSHRH